MQTWSFRGSGEPAWVIASSNACFRLGPDPRRALGPAAIRAASTGRTHDRTRPMLHQRKKALVNQAPSTHDPKRTLTGLQFRSAAVSYVLSFGSRRGRQRPTSGVHPLGWTDGEGENRLTEPGFRGESPWPSTARIRSSSSARSSKNFWVGSHCTPSRGATGSAAI